MKQKTFDIVVDQEVINYIQLLGINVESRKNALVTIGEALGDEHPSYKSYEKEYYKNDAEYQLAKDSLQNTYIPKKVIDNGNVEWKLDFATNVLSVIVRGDANIVIAEALLKDIAQPESEDARKAIIKDSIAEYLGKTYE